MEFLGNFLKSPDTDSYYYTAHIKVQKFQAADKLLLLINGVRSSKVQVMRRFIGFILGKLGLGSCSSTLKQQHQRQSQYVGVFFDSFILPEGLPLQQYVPNTLPLLNFSRDAVCVYCRISDWSRDSLQVLRYDATKGHIRLPFLWTVFCTQFFDEKSRMKLGKYIKFKLICELSNREFIRPITNHQQSPPFFRQWNSIQIITTS